MGQRLAGPPALGRVVAARAGVTGIAREAIVEEKVPAGVGPDLIDLLRLWQGRERAVGLGSRLERQRGEDNNAPRGTCSKACAEPIPCDHEDTPRSNGGRVLMD